MGGARVLVVEDDASIAAGLVTGLKRVGFEVELATTVQDATRRALGAAPFDVVVLDLMLPDDSGFTVLEQLRHRTSAHVVVLTARSELADRLRSFELGAADYLSKPFWMDELVARIRARLDKNAARPSKMVSFGAVALNVDARAATIDGEPVALTKTELDILVYLTTRPGRAVSRAQLAEQVLPSMDEGDLRTVDAHVSRLRKKLGPDGARIVTVWGIGYRFDEGGST